MIKSSHYTRLRIHKYDERFYKGLQKPIKVARDSIKKKIAQLSFLKGFRMDSDITADEALKLGQEVNQLLVKRYKRD